MPKPKVLPLRIYQPLWNQIKIDFERQFTPTPPDPNLYTGTVVYNVPPELYARVDKAIRKEKNWYDHGEWRYSRYTKLTSTYNSDNFSIQFLLKPYRQEELLQDLARKAL